MTAFTQGQIATIRQARRSDWPVAAILTLFPNHTRDEVVIAMDATIREQRDFDAMHRANDTIYRAQNGQPSINNRPAHNDPQRPQAMF